MKNLSTKIIDNLAKLESRIGNTPIVDLGNGIYGKVEGQNPAGSVKDRAAFYIIKTALEQGELSENGTVVEATSGNTGIGLAFVARELGLHSVMCMPESMTVERRQMIQKYGAELVLTPASAGMAGAVSEAKRIEQTDDAFRANQFGNPASIEAHYKTTAPELFKQLSDVKHVICGVGSGGTAMGFAKYISEHCIDCEVIGVEPSASPLMTKGYAGAHKIQGIGANFIPEIVDVSKLNRIETVDDSDALNGAKELYQLSGLKCGVSSGAVFSVAKRLRSELTGNIAIILPDNGERYSESLYID